MKKILIFVLIVATLLSVCIIPTVSAADTGYKGDKVVSDKVETDFDWMVAFSSFQFLLNEYYGVKGEYYGLEGRAPKVRVTYNIAGSIAVGEYSDGVFHDVWPDDALVDGIVYNDVYFAIVNGKQVSKQYKNGDVKDTPADVEPLLVSTIRQLNLTDIAKDYRRTRFTYSDEAKAYVGNGNKTVKFENGKVVNIAFPLDIGGEIVYCDVFFEYDTTVIALPTELSHFRKQGDLATTINKTFGGLDYNVAKFMNKIANSFIGGVATFLMKAVTFITEKGIIFFLIAIILMCFAKTRKAGLLMFVSVAVGAILTNIVFKGFIARTRPYETNTIYYGFWQAVGCPVESGYSFPSGHTTAVMAAAMAFFICFKKRYSWTGFIAVLAVGVSRIYLMAHYTSDVLAGVLVGGVSGILAIYITKLIYYIIEHYRDDAICKAILTKDLSEMFKRKKKPVIEPVQETVPVMVADAPVSVATVEEKIDAVIAEKQNDEKAPTAWEESLLSLMVEVRDLLKNKDNIDNENK